MTHIEQRIDQAAVLASVNPVPHKGEAVHEEDTGRWKIGDGETAYNDLPYKAGVDSVAGKTGAVALFVQDVTGAAPTHSPTFTGSPKAPTRAASDSSTNIATTAYVNHAVAMLNEQTDAADTVLGALIQDVSDEVDLKAPLVSPALTGNPTAPTPAAGDNDTSIATTAFVKAAVDTAVPNLERVQGPVNISVNTAGEFSWTIPGGGFPNALLFASVVQGGDPGVFGQIGPFRILPSSTKSIVQFKSSYTGAALSNVTFYLHAIGN